MNKSIGNRCRIARESAQFTQAQAANFLSLTPRRLRDYETDVAKESVTVYKAMAFIYEVSLNWLLLGIGPMKLDSPITNLFLVWYGIPEDTRDALWKLMVNLSTHKPSEKDNNDSL